MFVLIITVALCGYAWLLPKRGEHFRALATRIHTLIAARTGLPLRELRADAVLVGQA